MQDTFTLSFLAVEILIAYIANKGVEYTFLEFAVNALQGCHCQFFGPVDTDLLATAIIVKSGYSSNLPMFLASLTLSVRPQCERIRCDLD